MSVLFPLGIPIYYLLVLYRHRTLINPPLSAILKDRDYVAAFALSGRRKYIDNRGVAWKKTVPSVGPPTKTRRSSSLAEALRSSLADFLHPRRRAAVASASCFLDSHGNRMDADTKEAAKQEWAHEHPELAASLEGRDFRSQFQQKQKRVGFQQARYLMQCRARALSLPARRFAFLWGPYTLGMW